VMKLGICVIVMLMLGPYIFHIKLSRNLEDDAQLYKEFLARQKNRVKETIIKVKPVKDVDNEPAEADSIVEEKALKVVKEVPKAVLGQVKGNFEPADREVSNAPGEGGRPVEVPARQRALAQHMINEYGFNMVASDQVAMDRVIPDTRLRECQNWHYPEENQPTASVILVFHNEGFSTLVRTVHSVINMSPPHLLKEVVMVDDASTKEHLKDKLANYLEQFGDLVKLYRNKEREGLIRTRSRGANEAKGEVIVFLDAHCECNKNWLIPLLDRIRVNRKTMACPIIDGIDWNDMHYSSVYGSGRNHQRGIFEWGLLYKESKVPRKELKSRDHESEPYRSPTHAGGLFAMDRAYFHELGGYDPGLYIWGGENYELSFKIWQCGGKIEWVPCSRVGHIYRNHMPYSLGKKINPHMSPIQINYMRVIHVWMDPEFQKFFYTREPALQGFNYGNITKQLAFKKENKCKSFKWFMDNIAYDVYEDYPKPPPNKAWGEIRLKNKNLCWDAHAVDTGGPPVSVSYCHGGGGTQQFRLNVKGQIAIGERCIAAQGADTLHIEVCSKEPTGPWEWDETTGKMRHTELKKCVMAASDNVLHLRFCGANDPGIVWEINEVYPWKKAM